MLVAESIRSIRRVTGPAACDSGPGGSASMDHSMGVQVPSFAQGAHMLNLHVDRALYHYRLLHSCQQPHAARHVGLHLSVFGALDLSARNAQGSRHRSPIGCGSSVTYVKASSDAYRIVNQSECGSSGGGGSACISDLHAPPGAEAVDVAARCMVMMCSRHDVSD